MRLVRLAQDCVRCQLVPAAVLNLPTVHDGTWKNIFFQSELDEAGSDSCAITGSRISNGVEPSRTTIRDVIIHSGHIHYGLTECDAV
jgi:hypothetical protein